MAAIGVDLFAVVAAVVWIAGVSVAYYLGYRGGAARAAVAPRARARSAVRVRRPR